MHGAQLIYYAIDSQDIEKWTYRIDLLTIMNSVHLIGIHIVLL